MIINIYKIEFGEHSKVEVAVLLLGEHVEEAVDVLVVVVEAQTFGELIAKAEACLRVGNFSKQWKTSVKFFDVFYPVKSLEKFNFNFNL